MSGKPSLRQSLIIKQYSIPPDIPAQVALCASDGGPDRPRKGQPRGVTASRLSSEEFTRQARHRYRSHALCTGAQRRPMFRLYEVRSGSLKCTLRSMTCMPFSGKSPANNPKHSHVVAGRGRVSHTSGQLNASGAKVHRLSSWRPISQSWYLRRLTRTQSSSRWHA